MSRRIRKTQSFLCDGGCHAVYVVGESTPIHRDSPRCTPSLSNWRCVKGNKASHDQHFCPECWSKRLTNDAFMAEAYRESFRRGIPYPQEVVDWFNDNVDEEKKYSKFFSQHKVIQEFNLEGFGLPRNYLKKQALAFFYGTDGGWRVFRGK